jgi:hypothetical protein
MPDMGHQYVWTATETIGIDTTASRGTLVTAGNSDAKGSYAEVAASTSFDYAGIVVAPGFNSALARYAIDIAVGAEASEQVILPDFLIGENTLGPYHPMFVPVGIPAGSRLAVRAQNSLAAGTNTLRFTGIGIGANPRWPSPSSTRAAALGFTSAGTKGTSIDPGGTAHTKGSWVEVVATTAEEYRGLYYAVTVNNNGTTTGTTVSASTHWLFDIGIGGSGSEVAVIPNIHWSVITSKIHYKNQSWYPVGIPAGSRLSVRCQCSVNTAVERIMDVVLYGLC